MAHESLNRLMLSSGLAALVAVGAAGCRRDEANASMPPIASTAPGSSAREPVRDTPALAPAPACPESRFEAFARRFADDVALQRRFTASPLRMQSIDATAEPEPAPVVQQLSASQIQFPVVPDQAQRDERHLAMTFDEAGASMKVAAPDSDDQTTYRFRKDACWTLTSVESDSL